MFLLPEHYCWHSIKKTNMAAPFYEIIALFSEEFKLISLALQYKCYPKVILRSLRKVPNLFHIVHLFIFLYQF